MWNWNMWYFTCVFGTCDISHVKFHMLTHVKLCVSHVKFHMWIWNMWYITCEHMWNYVFHMWNFTKTVPSVVIYIYIYLTIIRPRRGDYRGIFAETNNCFSIFTEFILISLISLSVNFHKTGSRRILYHL
jgi:hypothetical protein